MNVSEQNQLQRPVYFRQRLERNAAVNQDFLVNHHRIAFTASCDDVVVDHNELRSTTGSAVVGSL